MVAFRIFVGVIVALLAPTTTAQETERKPLHKDLVKAIKDNNAALVNMALKSFGRVDAVGEDGDTALMLAVRTGKYKAVKSLIKGKADTQIPDAHGLTVMHVAAAGGHARVMQALLPAGVDANPPPHEADGYRPIHRAVLSGDTDSVKTLLNAEVAADEPTADGTTPSQLAAASDLPSKEKMAIEEVLKKFARPTKSEL